MPSLYNWYLARHQDGVIARGYAFGHPSDKVFDGCYIHTSPIQRAEVEGGALALTTASGTEYLLRPEEIHPDRAEDVAEELALLGIGADLIETCLQAVHKREKEEEQLVEPGELLLTTCRNWTIRALFRAADGALVRVKRTIHGGTFEDSILITDWNGGKVDFRYFPTENGARIKPYHISNGLRVIKIHNLASSVFFGDPDHQVICPVGEITAIPAAEYDNEWLFSPDVVDGKNLFKHQLQE